MIGLQGIFSCYNALNGISGYLKGEFVEGKYDIFIDLVKNIVDVNENSDLYINTDYLTSYNKVFSYLNLGKDDTVMVSSFTNIEVINLLSFYKVNIVTVDINLSDLKTSLDDIKNKLTDKVKLIITTDINGCSSVNETWKFLWEENNICVIQDATESLGSSVNEIKVGGLSPITIINFSKNSVLNVLESSLLIINKDMLNYLFSDIQYNIRYKHIIKSNIGLIDDIRCIIGIEQLNHYQILLSNQQLNGSLYRTSLITLDKIKLIEYDINELPSYSSFPVLVDNTKELKKYLKNNEIQSGIIYKTHMNNIILPNLKQYYNKCIYIPVGWWLSFEQKYKIIDVLKKYDEN